ncbi:MAG: tryptophan synthase subunit alpha [Chloroflexi bacterium]|nr:tryptophan synthase subunit alpha [Chloroflexota bacterium]
MSRLAATFARLKTEGRTGIIAYLTVGYPDVETTSSLVSALEVAGADVIELGVPFSDPLADGVTIQRASYHALQEGVTLQKCLETCSRLRDMGASVPLVLMGYYNPFLNMGLDRFGVEAAKAEVDGVIVPDLPPEEAAAMRQACVPRGVDLIFMLAPTSTDERIAWVCQMATGFVYCVSLTGVTGARRELPTGLPDFVTRVRRCTSLPLAVGFGISTRAHVETVGKYADGVVVGSALVDLVGRTPKEILPSKVKEFIRDLRGAQRRH